MSPRQLFWNRDFMNKFFSYFEIDVYKILLMCLGKSLGRAFRSNLKKLTTRELGKQNDQETLHF